MARKGEYKYKHANEREREGPPRRYLCSYARTEMNFRPCQCADAQWPPNQPERRRIRDGTEEECVLDREVCEKGLLHHVSAGAFAGKGPWLRARRSICIEG